MKMTGSEWFKYLETGYILQTSTLKFRIHEKQLQSTNIGTEYWSFSGLYVGSVLDLDWQVIPPTPPAPELPEKFPIHYWITTHTPMGTELAKKINLLIAYLEYKEKV